MVQRTYNCSQQELYTVCLLGWQSYQQHLAAFTTFKAKYDAPFGDARVVEVKDAMNLPDDQARTAISETFRIQLEQLAKDCLAKWQMLKRYIADAWPPQFQKPKTEAAGQNYYAKASNNDWESVRALTSSGMLFIDNNLVDLQANQNMPPTFQDTFKTAKEGFAAKHQEFLDSEEGAEIESDNKGKANNDIHTKLMSMFLDAQEIFKNDDAIKKQFIFEQVLNLASGTGTAGFRGTATDEATGLPIADVLFTIKGSDKTTTSGEDGKFIITQLAADTYNVEASKEGYQGKQFTQTVKVGTISTVNIALVKV